MARLSLGTRGFATRTYARCAFFDVRVKVKQVFQVADLPNPMSLLLTIKRAAGQFDNNVLIHIASIGRVGEFRDEICHHV